MLPSDPRRATRSFLVLVLVVVLAATLAAASGAAAATVVHTRIQAERNVLHAHRVLHRLDPRLVNPRTGLPRTDTSVVCRGEGRRRDSAWPRFVCEISHRRVHVRVQYFAQRRNGFELRRLRRSA
jgi:hypothetical protein